MTIEDEKEIENDQQIKAQDDDANVDDKEAADEVQRLDSTYAQMTVSLGSSLDEHLEDTVEDSKVEDDTKQ